MADDSFSVFTDRETQKIQPADSGNVANSTNADTAQQTDFNLDANTVHEISTRRNIPLADKLADYEVGGVLGRGGFGTVYKARDPHLNRQVAIKFLTNPLEESDLKLFKREATAIAMLGKHPNVVQIYQWGEIEGHPFFVLEFVSGSAEKELEKCPTGLPIAQALSITADCAEALAFAHKNGILHRDIKPANILIEMETSRAKLADFGLARVQSVEERSFTVGASGSPPYMSPEQSEGRDVDARSDIFSLGVTLYKLLTNQLPFEGKNYLEILDNIRSNKFVPVKKRKTDLPDGLCKIVEKAMANKKADRYQNADQFAAEMRTALAAMNEGKEIEQTQGLMPTRRWAISSMAAMAAIVVVVAVVVNVIIASMNNTIPVALAEANNALSRGDFELAEQMYKAVTAKHSRADVWYGLSFALLEQKKLDEAAQTVEKVKDSAMKAELGAALAFERTPGDAAQEAISQARSVAKRPYLDVLQAKLQLAQNQYDAVVQELANADANNFPYTWQYAEALESLGKAYYALQKFPEAKASYAAFEEKAPANQQAVAAALVKKADNQASEEHRKAIQEAEARIKQVLDSNYKPQSIDNFWTSRPLTFFILPTQFKSSRYAESSGLAEVMAQLLGEELDKQKPMELVEREIISDLLAEQALSAQVSSRSGQLALGNVLGARLILLPKFVTFEKKESLMMEIADTETTKRLSVERIDINPAMDPMALIQAAAKNIFDAARKAYPLQGRLYAAANGPEINVGATAGVATGMKFDVFVDPEVKPLENAVVTAGTPGASICSVKLEGVEPSKLVDKPEQGFYVRERQEPNAK